MRTVLILLVLLTWALWLGGLVTLVILVVTLFRGDREIAVEAAPRMFVVFGQYQLLLAAVALIATFVWRLLVSSAWITAIFTLFAIAVLSAVSLSVRVVPRMEQIRLAGQSHDSL